MTVLTFYKSREFPSLEEQYLEDILLCKIFFLIEGRNSWHSTWIQKYTHNCMHTNLKSACTYAEQARKQGSQFIIRELPAFCFISDPGHFFITEINNDKPLSGYSHLAISEEPKNGHRKISGALDNYCISRATMRGVILSFDHQSRFWKQAPPEKNSIMVLGSEEDKLVPAPLGVRLSQYHSNSLDAQFPLRWEQVASRISSDQIVECFASIKRQFL